MMMVMMTEEGGAGRDRDAGGVGQSMMIASVKKLYQDLYTHARTREHGLRRTPLYKINMSYYSFSSDLRSASFAQKSDAWRCLQK